MKAGRKVVALSVVVGLLVWVTDAILDWLVSSGGTLWGALISDVSVREIYMRSVAFAAILAFGIAISIASARRKRAEEAVKAERQRLHDVLEMLPAYVVLLSPDHHVPFANRFFRERFGESHGRRCFEYLFGRSEPCESCETYKVLETGQPHRWEWTGPDGRNYDIFDFPFTDAHGSAAIMEMGIDITERKQAAEVVRKAYDTLEVRVGERTAELAHANARLQAEVEEHRKAEEALRESEEKYRRLFEELTDAALLADTQTGIILDANAQAEALLGRTREEIIGMHQSELHPPGKAEEYRERFAEHVRRGRAADYDGEVVRKDGTTVPVNISAGAMAIGGEHLILGLFHDITERKRAQQEIERLARFPSENPNPVLRISADGTVLYSNKAGSSLLEHLDWQPGRSVPSAWRQPLADALSSGQSSEAEVQCGDRVFVLTFAPVVDSNYVNVYGLDITERKRAEQERHRMQERMQESQRLESMGVLAGGIAHDFNNLLMIVLGNADLALRDLSPVSPARDRLIEIEHGARRAADLCRQLLGYSGRGRFVIEPIDLSELVEEMAHMLEMSISKKAVLRYDLSKGLPAVVADATQMRQIVMNLIINASEAIGERSGVISIATGAMECDRRYLSGTYPAEDLPEGRYVYMEVSDTGCGMTKEVRERLFEPYFTTRATGRGLGLAAVLGIVRGHKGAVKIYSEEGKGTTMKVLLPVSDVPALARQQGAGTEPEEWTGSGTVLLVDDEETVRAVAGQMIERAGFDVITAQGGREAVEIYRERRDEITCVVLDLTMPHMSGEECFRELRRMDKDVRVILSSGYTEQDATERFAGKGLAGFIQKPYELAQLKDKFRECLGG